MAGRGVEGWLWGGGMSQNPRILLKKNLGLKTLV